MTLLVRYTFAVLLCCSAHLVADCPSADLTGDCRVDFADLKIIASQWSISDSEPNDLTGGSLFDFADFALLSRQWKVRGVGSNEMVLIPAGTFQMGDSFGEGDSTELPVHLVTLSSFHMSKHHCTIFQYCQFLNSALSQGSIKVSSDVVYKADSGMACAYCDTSSSSSRSYIIYNGESFTIGPKGGRDMSDDPMVCVSWYGAVAYCNWRSEQDGLQPCYDLSTWTFDFSKNGYHVPTEAQWEYAARGGLSGKRFPWGDTISHDHADYYSGGYSYDTSTTRCYHPAWDDGISPLTSPVGAFPANGYGLYDMAGNVWEWCNDWLERYSSASRTNPTGPTRGTAHVIRGGCWFSDAAQCRVAFRFGCYSNIRSSSIGFRICR